MSVLFVALQNAAPIVPNGGFDHETLYAIGTIVVAIATLVGAMATYRSIKDRSQLRSYDELEKSLEEARVEFRKDIGEVEKNYRIELARRDREHQEERDLIDQRWREQWDKKERVMDEKVQTLNERVTNTEWGIRRLVRVSKSAIRHIDTQDHMMIDNGITPLPLPIEVEIYKNEIIEKGDNDDGSN